MPSARIRAMARGVTRVVAGIVAGTVLLGAARRLGDVDEHRFRLVVAKPRDLPARAPDARCFGEACHQCNENDKPQRC